MSNFLTSWQPSERRDTGATERTGLENRSRGNSTENSNPPLFANHSTKSITYKALLVLSCINLCIKAPLSRPILLTTDTVFYHFATRRASTFMFPSSYSQQQLSHSPVSDDKTVELQLLQTDPVGIYQRKWIAGEWMKKSETRKALKAWLDAKRYEAVERLTLQHLYVKVERRTLAYRMLLSRNTIPTFNRLMLGDYCSKILSGEIFSSGDTATLGREPAGTYTVNPTTRSRVQFYAKTLALTKATPELSGLSQSEFLSEYLKETPLNNLSRITVDIHLEEASIEEIIEHLKVLIPRWKRQLKMKSPAPREYRFGKSAFRRIIECRLIPMMDLVFWGEDNSIKIPFSLISSLPHEDSDNGRDEGMLKATGYPLAMAFLTDASYLRSLEDYMMENSHLRGSPVGKHVEDDRSKKK